MNKGANKRQPVKKQQPAVVEMEVDGDANMSEDEEGGTRIGGIYIPPPIPPHCSSESKGPRMIISNISNTNFKSYAGTVVLGPFHQRFSAIIGPNGSGKSNVIDSMLFVFGYRAQKIRSKKLSVLLHNSSSHPNINSCSVAVHFKEILDKEDGSFEEIPNSEVVISRTAFRDNSSYYTINDKRVHFKEVSLLLRKHGIDLDHNRFLILQGEVESISMMKPKALTDNDCGLLEYLEDIIGTTRYKTPLVRINERVEKLNEERTEKHNRCKLAEREMKDLEKPMNEAVEYLKLKNTFTRTHNLQIQKYLFEQDKQLVIYTQDKEAQIAVIDKHDAKYEELRKQRLEKEASLKEEVMKLNQLQKQHEECEAKLKVSFDKYTAIQANMTATNKRRKTSMQQIEKEKEKIEELKKVPDSNRKEIIECEQKIVKLNKQKVEAEETLAKNYTALKDETKALLEQKDKLQTELIDLKKVVDESKSVLTIAESELKLCKHNETTEKRKLESMRSSFEESQKTLEENTVTLDELQKVLPGIQEKLAESRAALQENRVEERETVQRLRVIKAKVDESVNAMQTTRSQGKVLDALMQQKNKGNIPGILGRLGDLGAIDAKYDVAISTCCGRLEWIVVDTVNTGQACIEYLKKHNVGRASFITLEKVEHFTQQCNRSIQTPENVPRLFDLVRVEDERVRPAFYYALRDTLVGNDLDQGSRIAYGKQRYRVVTLNGDVIETTGTMSGGGRTQIRGRMGQRVATKTSGNTPKSNKELEHLQVQSQELQSRVNFLQEEQGTLEREIEKLNSSSRSKEGEIKRLKITIQSLKEQLPRIQDQLKKQQKKVDNTQSDPEKVAQLEEQVVSNKAIFDKSKKAADKIQKQVDGFTTQITEITNTKVKSVQTKISGLTKQIDKLAANISKLTVDITQSERNLSKTTDKIKNLEAEVTAAQDSLRKSDEERTVEDQNILKFTNEARQLKEDLTQFMGESSGVKKEIEAIQKRENDGKMKRLELEQILQKIEKQLAEVKAVIPHWKRKLLPLKLEPIPGETEPQEPLKTFTNEELEEENLEEIQYQYSVQEEELKHCKPNLSVIEEFVKKREAYLQCFQILEDITQKRNEMRQLYDEVKKKRFTEFMAGFNVITKKLKEMYQMITLGGDAELELVDSMDPFNEGIVFSVRPPKKSWKMISNLSGGEKTLSSLALVFALHYYKPSPLYVMDEIDAALDFKNVSIVAHYIKQRTKNAQFIIISLRSNMFELSDYLVGIYKVSDCTGSITIENQPPASVASNKVLYTDSFAAPQNVAFDSSIHEEDKENEQPVKGVSQEIQLSLTPPSQALPDMIDIEQAAA